MTDLTPLTEGSRLAGRYTVQVCLRADGYEQFYRATTDWGQSVLITVFRPPQAETPTGGRARQVFMRNARLLAQLQRPGVVRVSDLLDEDGTQLVVCEDRLNQTLRQAAGDPSQELPPGKWLDLTRALFSALVAAHAQALLHARISPDHVWLDTAGDVWLADFGLANRALQEIDLTPPPDPRYAAPELLSGGVFSPQTDVYALAATLLEVLSGRTPPTASARLRGVPLPTLTRPGSAALNHALAVSLALEPSERAIGAGEVLEILERALNEQGAQPQATPEPAAAPLAEVTVPIGLPASPLPVPPTPVPSPPGPPPRRRSRWPLALGLVALLGVGGAALLAVPGLLRPADRAPSTEQTENDAYRDAPLKALQLPASEPAPTAPTPATPAQTPLPPPPPPPPTVRVLSTVVVNTANLNLRDAANNTSPVVLTLPRGTRLEVLEIQGEWSRVRTVGGEAKEGWVKTELTLELRSPQETAELVAQIAAGGSVTVPAGAFLLGAPLVIETDIELTGAGLKTTLLMSDAAQDTLIVRGAALSLSDLGVAHLGRVPARSVLQEGGSLSLSRVLLTGAVRDDATSEYGSGLWVKDAGEAQISDSSVTGNVFGIYVSDRSQVAVSSTVLNANRDGAFLFKDQSGGTVTTSTIEGNGSHGVHITGQATPELSANRIRDNRGRGVTVYGQATPTIHDNTIESNTLQGIGVQDTATPDIENNVIQGNRQSGVTYFDNAGGSASGNTVQANQTAGFRITEYAAPTLNGNTVVRNRENGLGYSEYAAGSASRNTITANSNPGIAVWGDAEPTLNNNMVSLNKQSGVVLAERSAPQLSDNRIDGNTLYGLIVTGNATPEVTGNTITGNGKGGIFYKQQAGGTGSGNSCFDNGGEALALELAADAPGPDLDATGCGP
ncbi:right-handed parallel beta-helix repeat-containing protein [Deinococcus marmoris]|uniref:Serine/threonine kinase n=1 Tax=Deinococcus marmoris TaxID=249408 RepID=A0A1U7NZX0_9DEIO|nr:right-handed parallel beta-helix repeat-containing protein [Deinococcus marmoris]OLV18467.1 serine/threonine kinase [Deinococcus marmoris]